MASYFTPARLIKLHKKNLLYIYTCYILFARRVLEVALVQREGLIDDIVPYMVIINALRLNPRESNTPRGVLLVR